MTTKRTGPARLSAPARCLVLAAALVAVGCGGRGDLVGKVTYLNRPVAAGTVLVVGSDGVPHSGAIEKDGSYKVSSVPYGPAKIGVTSPNPAAEYQQLVGVQKTPEQVAKIPKPDPALAQLWFAIPDQYQNPDRSGLTAVVNAPVTTQDLPLK